MCDNYLPGLFFLDVADVVFSRYSMPFLNNAFL